MRADSRDGSQHIADLLPDYVAGQLPDAVRRKIDAHIARCAFCADELEEWQRIAATERLAAIQVFEPSPATLTHIFALIDAPPHVWRREMTSSTTRLKHMWRVAFAQVRLLHWSLWIATAVGVALSTVVALSTLDASSGVGVLAYILPLIAATGTAFLYGPEIDPGLELAIATPTSQRLVLASRFALLFTYNFGLALLATLLLVTLREAGFDALWPILTSWLGPMALLSSLSLALTVILTPVVAAAAGAMLWFARFFQLDAGVSLTVPGTGLWQTSPLVLMLTVTLVAAALIYVQRNERMPAEVR